MKMKKLLVFISALAMSIMLLAGVCSAAASQGSNGKDKVAILLMGSNDFKSTQYFTMIEKHILKNNPHASQIAFTAYYPASYILRGGNPWFCFGVGTVIAAVLLTLSILLWNRGLRAYESAGS